MRENYPYRGVKGMRDVFPEESLRFQAVERASRDWFSRYGFGEVRTPLLEHTVLFERGVGQGTDIVNKEMFYVPAKDQDEGGGDAARRMVLRPEATASVVRAYVENEIDKVSPGAQRYYYLGPMFRYERPQRGRLRQFTQIGVEFLGAGQPVSDAEVILLLMDLLGDLGLGTKALLLNSVGCRQCRPGYIQALKGFVDQQRSALCADCQARSEKNPLRLFDCKQADCRRVLRAAPSIQDHLCPDCRTHQAQLTRLLQAAGVPFTLDPRLMRGLDYYTRTVFEVVSQDLGAQNAVAAGGRYDHLVEELAGPVTPAVGWSLGLERLLELGLNPGPAPDPLDLFVVAPGPDLERTWLAVRDLRRQGFKVGLELESKSPKALMKRADKLGARFALFVSEQDPGRVELKDLATGEQVPTPWAELALRLKGRTG